MFSLPDVVDAGLDLASGGRSNLISSELLERDALKRSVLFGMAEQMGRELSVIRGDALRRSVALLPGKPYMSTQSYPEFTEPHRRGELLVAAFLNAALTSGWRGLPKSVLSRLATRTEASSGRRPLASPVTS